MYVTNAQKWLRFLWREPKRSSQEKILILTGITRWGSYRMNWIRNRYKKTFTNEYLAKWAKQKIKTNLWPRRLEEYAILGSWCICKEWKKKKNYFYVQNSIQVGTMLNWLQWILLNMAIPVMSMRLISIFKIIIPVNQKSAPLPCPGFERLWQNL